MSGFLEVAFGFRDRRQIELGQGVVGGSEQGRLGGCAGPSDVAAGEESSREQVGHVDDGADHVIIDVHVGKPGPAPVAELAEGATGH